MGIINYYIPVIKDVSVINKKKEGYVKFTIKLQYYNSSSYKK